MNQWKTTAKANKCTSPGRTSQILWLKEFSKTLRELGLVRIDEEVCLFRNDWLLVFFYVDDIAALCRTADLPKLHEFKDALMQKYEMRFMGNLQWFLGIRVIRDRLQRKIWLCQDSYIEKITKAFNLTYMKPAKIPMIPEEYSPYDGKALPQKTHLYQRKVGSILYAATITRPDVAKTASKLSEFLQNPSPRHHAAVDQAITYLYGTKSYAIEFSADTNEQHVLSVLVTLHLQTIRLRSRKPSLRLLLKLNCSLSRTLLRRYIGGSVYSSLFNWIQVTKQLFHVTTTRR
jgi:hypothetical protein